MVAADQPRCFNSRVIVAVSSSADGQMQLGWSEPTEQVTGNRQIFLQKAGLCLEQSVLLRVVYDRQGTYDVIREATTKDCGGGMTKLEGEAADCLITDTRGVALLLPVADCIGAVIHDPRHNAVASTHLGRHSTIAKLAFKTVSYLTTHYRSQPDDLIVWMSPSIQPPNYVLAHADFVKDDTGWSPFCQAVEGGFSLDLQGYNRQQFIEAGVQPASIHISPINTATSPNYWSHYTETTVYRKAALPRFAVACALK